jgi:hypothetical protein
VQSGAPGQFVDLVASDNTVAVQVVRTGVSEDGMEQVTDGLKPGLLPSDLPAPPIDNKRGVTTPLLGRVRGRSGCQHGQPDRRLVAGRADAVKAHAAAADGTHVSSRCR